MKVIIAGSRSITDVQILYRAIKDSGFDITQVVCGEAKGVALARGLKIHIHQMKLAA